MGIAYYLYFYFKNQFVFGTFQGQIRIIGKGCCFWGHGYVHQGQTLWCQQFKTN